MLLVGAAAEVEVVAATDAAGRGTSATVAPDARAAESIDAASMRPTSRRRRRTGLGGAIGSGAGEAGSARAGVGGTNGSNIGVAPFGRSGRSFRPAGSHDCVPRRCAPSACDWVTPIPPGDGPNPGRLPHVYPGRPPLSRSR